MGAPRWLWRWLGSLAAGGALLTGLIGFAHTEAGRPLLRLLPSPGASCPIGADLTPEARDAARAQVLSGLRGEVPAQGRQALGFALGQAHWPDVLAWTQANHLDCTVEAQKIQCRDVPAAALGDGASADEVVLGFDAQGRLISAVSSQGGLSAEVAIAQLASLSAQVAEHSGPWSQQRGQPSADWLAAGTLNQTAYEFTFSDYNARIAATHMGQGRVILRQAYQTLD